MPEPTDASEVCAAWRKACHQSLAEMSPHPVFQVKGAAGAASRFHP